MGQGDDRMEKENNRSFSLSKGKKRQAAAGAFAFIVLMGIVSLFSDMTHEGARSILGEYLNLAGASAATIGFVSGIGELCGYSLRLLSGLIADKTKKYWTLVIVGYVVQVLAIPALALIPENGWVFACSCHSGAYRKGHKEAGKKYARQLCRQRGRHRKRICVSGVSRSARRISWACGSVRHCLSKRHEQSVCNIPCLLCDTRHSRPDHDRPCHFLKGQIPEPGNV